MLGRLRRLRNHYLLRSLLDGFKQTLSERVTRIAFAVALFILLLGIVGPALAPYEYDAQQYDENGELQRLQSPTVDHPLGTTDRGQDVLSRVLYGARPTVITGLLGGFIMLAIGLVIGVTAGYVGGRVESVLMRFTDFAYGIPFIPFAIVLLAFFDTGFYMTIIVIGVVMWRFIARILRSQVLQIKERPFIMAAKTSGASTPRVIVKHIVPNIASMAVLFFSMGVGIAILKQAGLAFLGMTNPFLPTWGTMIRNAYLSGLVGQTWWWTFPPGIMISATVLSLYLLGRGYENTGDQTEYMG
jgi:peptide/nickel transport system permease protein